MYITKEEFLTALNRLSNLKTSGLDNIPIELMTGGDVLQELYIFINKIFETGKGLSEYFTSLMIPIQKISNV